MLKYKCQISMCLFPHDSHDFQKRQVRLIMFSSSVFVFYGGHLLTIHAAKSQLCQVM